MVSVWKETVITDAFSQDTIINELSAAQIRYLINNEYEDKTFIVAIINLATKGWITISEDKQNIYTLKKLPQKNLGKISRDEKLIYIKLFSNKNSNEITLNKRKSKTIINAKQAHKSKITTECEFEQSA